MKDLKYFLSLPYTVVLRPDEDGGTVARVEELPGCVTGGTTVSEALEKLEDLKRAWIEDAIDAGHTVPEPVPEEVLPSGKWVQRVPRSLHRKLSIVAKKENVSLNALVTSILSEAVGVTARPQVAPELTTALIGQTIDGSVNLWHQPFSSWLNEGDEVQSIVTVHSTQLPNNDICLADRLEWISAGLPKNHRRISLKAIYNDEKKQRLGKAC